MGGCRKFRAEINLKSEIPVLRIIRHSRNAGQSRALRTGVRDPFLESL